MNFNENPKQPKTLEQLGEICRKKLDDILYMELTVENINDFAQTAEKRLLKLNDEILKQYLSNPLFEANKTFTIKEQEDDAYKKLGLPNLQDILKLIVDKIEQISGLKNSIQVQKNFSNEIITPPQSGDIIIEPGSGTFFEKEKLPRLLTLIYVLTNDLKIPLEDIDITEGAVSREMMRKTPYSRIAVPTLNRVVYICDEEDNASYIFDAQKLEAHEVEVLNLDIDDKNEKNELIVRYPGIGVRIIQSRSWRKLVAKALSKPIEIDFDQNRREREIEKVNKSEFIKNVSFDEFQDEVRRYYQAQGSPANIGDWYKNEYRKHANWPGDPTRTYKNKGWKNWEYLVGKEKKTFLSFGEFLAEVRILYQEHGNPQNIVQWYLEEYKKCPNWPRHPEKKYANNGWQSWADLVGKEKKTFLSFEEFLDEVRSLYQKHGNPKNIAKWYLKQYSMHPNWPSSPLIAYKNEGIKSLEDLVGKEKKTFLSFEQFLAEVRILYQEHGNPGNIIKWYFEEYENHPNWPGNPYEKYKNKGWQGWADLVGKEKKTFLPYEEFQAEVKKKYQEQGNPSNIKKWYCNEYNNHHNWPSNPLITYKNEGIESWEVLTGKEKRTFLPYEEFHTEVKKKYQEQESPVNIIKWYGREYKKHLNWPSAPYLNYASSGWESWEVMVGKEKKRFLPYSEFQAEVQKLYREQGSPSGSWNWYKNEYRKHANWPSDPARAYKNQSAESWDKIIGKEK